MLWNCDHNKCNAPSLELFLMNKPSCFVIILRWHYGSLAPELLSCIFPCFAYTPSLVVSHTDGDCTFPNIPHSPDGSLCKPLQLSRSA